MATLTSSILLDMRSVDPLDLGSYSTSVFDIGSATFTVSNDASNYVRFSGTLFPLVVTTVTKVVDGVSVINYSGGSVDANTVNNLYAAGDYDGIMNLFFTGDDTITGSRFNDVLDGRDGFDSIAGKAGNDRLYGNIGGDILNGGAGNDRLEGGWGNDTLIGGSGNDRFVFNSPLFENVDAVKDFTPGSDSILLDDAIFTGIGAPGALADASFVVSGPATSSAPTIIYNSTTGSLFFDPDGNGSATKILFAKLDPGLTLHATDFIIF